MIAACTRQRFAVGRDCQAISHHGVALQGGFFFEGSQIPKLDRSIFTGACQRFAVVQNGKAADACLVTEKRGSKRSRVNIPQPDSVIPATRGQGLAIVLESSAAQVIVVGGPGLLWIPEGDGSRLNRSSPEGDVAVIATARQTLAPRRKASEANGHGTFRQCVGRRRRGRRQPAQHRGVLAAAEKLPSLRMHGQGVYRSLVPSEDSPRFAAGRIPYDQGAILPAADQGLAPW